MKLTTLCLVLAVAAAGVIGCATNDGDDGSWTTVAEADLTPAQQQQLDRAMEARKILFSRLSTKLKSTLEEAGPVEAIGVCKDAAPVIAEEVSEEHGLRIGRTSFKLRNPENVAPDWAKSVVEDRVSENTYLAGPGGELGVMLPIRVQAPCLTCHGGEEDIPAEVQASLANYYPEDDGTGFTVEDLRGWFWIEVGS